MSSLRNRFADGQLCELGGELIDTGHTHIRDMAQELGIELDDLATDHKSLSRSVWYMGGQQRSELETVNAFQPLATRIRTTVEPFGASFDPTWRNPQSAEQLDRMTIAEWFDIEGLAGWLRTLLTVANTTKYGMEVDTQSALNFLQHHRCRCATVCSVRCERRTVSRAWRQCSHCARTRQSPLRLY